MSRAPRAKANAEINEYIAGWHATMQLLREGKSFSGRERNCAFLNCGASQFATVSAISGLDFPDDGRAVVSVDWDHDGDLDLWLQNRTGPRLRFLKNQTRESQSPGSSEGDPPSQFVAILLEGVRCNRDAIGARVEILQSRPNARRLIQTVRAGDGYLSQSSKWLHFGLGDEKRIEAVRVEWPNGEVEEFAATQVGQRYHFVQGTGEARSISARVPVALAAQPQAAVQHDSKIRAAFANPVALPLLEIRRDAENGPVSLLTAQDRPLLIVLWASWCPNCLQELEHLAAAREQINAGELDVIVLNVDHLAEADTDETASTNSAAMAVLQRLQFPFASGFATAPMMDKLQILQRVVLNRSLESAVPTSLLVNRHNELTAIYQGVHSIETFLADAKTCDASIAVRRDLTIPFHGTWTTSPDVLLLRPVANVFREAGYREDYERFLNIDRQRLARLQSMVADDQQQRELEVRYANDSLDLALSLLEAGQAEASLEYFQAGLERLPDSAAGHYQLGRAQLALGKTPAAATEFQTALQHNGEFYQAAFQLGLLAAADNRPIEAVRYFSHVVAAQPNHIEAWTNLGVVLARLKRPDEAINALQKAVELEPDRIQSLMFLGGQLASRGDFGEASQYFQRVTELQPNSAAAFAALGQTRGRLRDDTAAAAALQRALELNPNDAGSKLQLAWMQATSPVDAVRNGAAAVTAASELASQTQGRDPRVLDVLAAAHAENGQFPEAIAVASRALALVPTTHPLHKVIQDQLELFERKLPVRQPLP